MSPMRAAWMGAGERLWRAAEWVGRPWVALLSFVLTAMSSLGVIYQLGDPTVLMVAPFALLALSLAGSMWTRPRFRNDWPLLVFHLALLALVLLFALARLTYLDGQAAVSQGAEFDGRMVSVEQGPWHRDRLKDVRFQNLGVVARFDDQGEYIGNDNSVRWQGLDGQWRHADIGDDRPLLLAGYRIYATAHRGLALKFEWQDDRRPGELQRGSVQLQDHRDVPDTPPSAQWIIPDQDVTLWVQLAFQKLPQRGREQRDLGAAELGHELVLRLGDAERQTIKPGQVIRLPHGHLRYVGPDSWMSYRFVHEPMVPWIVITLAVAVLSLMVFYVQRVFRRPLPQE